MTLRSTGRCAIKPRSAGDLHVGHAGQYSIRVNDQWRVCFRFDSGSAYDAEIVDYH
ncbi:MAG: type II toxin-antitoxin system RelE/ParE family toxin [Betaproteobacteria bacterium]|nr:type II toxin-antitoxin system RelE/ParE family toxin [Betaproteobacteria bacterium]